MAMAARLQLVTDQEIASLVAEPTRINKLANDGFNSYWAQTISFLLCAEAYPAASREAPLTGMFHGFESVATPTLENGNFGIIRPGDVKAIATALVAVDLDTVKTRVEEADDDVMAEAECDDFELLKVDYEDPGQTIADDVKGLRAFYQKASKLGLGVVVYSS